MPEEDNRRRKHEPPKKKKASAKRDAMMAEEDAEFLERHGTTPTPKPQQQHGLTPEQLQEIPPMFPRGSSRDNDSESEDEEETEEADVESYVGSVPEPPNSDDDEDSYHPDYLDPEAVDAMRDLEESRWEAGQQMTQVSPTLQEFDSTLGSFSHSEAEDDDCKFLYETEPDMPLDGNDNPSRWMPDGLSQWETAEGIDAILKTEPGDNFNMTLNNSMFNRDQFGFPKHYTPTVPKKPVVRISNPYKKKAPPAPTPKDPVDNHDFSTLDRLAGPKGQTPRHRGIQKNQPNSAPLRPSTLFNNNDVIRAPRWNQEAPTNSEEQHPSRNPSPTNSDLDKELEKDDAELMNLLYSSAINSTGIQGLDEEEQAAVTGCKRGGNSAKTLDTEEALEERMFKTIENYGGIQMQYLLQMVPMNTDPEGKKNDRRFYNVLGGKYTEAKRLVLNSIFVLLFFKWKKLSGKKDEIGKSLQPNTFSKYMQKLGYVMTRKGIEFQWDKHFNGRGEFHGIVQDEWAKLRQKDRTYGINPNRKRTDPNLLKKIVAAIKEGKLTPYTNAQHLLALVIFINGYYCGLRGQKEHTELMMGDVVDGTFTEAEGSELAGLSYCGVIVPFDKTRQLKFNTSSLPAETEKLMLKRIVRWTP